MTINPLRAAATRAAALLLADASGQLPAEPVVVRLTDGFHEVRVIVEPCRYSLALPDPDGPTEETSREQQETAAPAHLTPLDRHILASAPAQHVTMNRLARLCAHEPDSYFQSRARRLAALGLLLRDFRGYRRA